MNFINFPNFAILIISFDQGKINYLNQVDQKIHGHKKTKITGFYS